MINMGWLIVLIGMLVLLKLSALPHQIANANKPKEERQQASAVTIIVFLISFAVIAWWIIYGPAVIIPGQH